MIQKNKCRNTGATLKHIGKKAAQQNVTSQDFTKQSPLPSTPPVSPVVNLKTVLIRKKLFRSIFVVPLQTFHASE